MEVSRAARVIAVHVPGLHGAKAKQRLGPRADALIGAMARLGQRAADKGAVVDPAVAAYEPGYSGFRLARVLRRSGVEIHVVQPVSVPVDRRARRAKTDASDPGLLPRTCLAFLRGEPRVCSVAPAGWPGNGSAPHALSSKVCRAREVQGCRSSGGRCWGPSPGPSPAGS